MNLAILLGINETSVIAWKHRGIPAKFFKPIIDKLPIDLDTLYELDQKIRTQK